MAGSGQSRQVGDGELPVCCGRGGEQQGPGGRWYSAVGCSWQWRVGFCGRQQAVRRCRWAAVHCERQKAEGRAASRGQLQRWIVAGRGQRVGGSELRSEVVGCVCVVAVVVGGSGC